MLLTIWLWCRACWIIQNAFLNDPKSQKGGFWLFFWVWPVEWSWYCILWWYLMFANIWAVVPRMLDHSQCIFEWAKVPKRGFLDFGLLDRLNIAYSERTKCFPAFNKITRSRKIIQKSQKCIFEWSKVPKRWFSGLRSFGSTWYCLWW